MSCFGHLNLYLSLIPFNYIEIENLQQKDSFVVGNGKHTYENIERHARDALLAEIKQNNWNHALLV